MSKTKQKILFLIISLFSGVLLFGQNLEQTFALAEDLHARKEYQSAIEAYNRVLFFDSEDAYRVESITALGDVYFEQAQYQRSVEFYRNALAISESDDKKQDIWFKLITSEIFSGNYFWVKDDIQNYRTEFPGDSLTTNAFMGIAHFALNEFDDSKNAFLRSVCDTCNTQKQEIGKLFSHKSQYRSPHAGLAGLLSAIIPGSGQMYSGHIGKGLNSMGLVGALAFLTINTALNYAWYDSFISVFPWFFRYYKGGITNSVKLASERRLEKRDKMFREIIRIASQN